MIWLTGLQIAAPIILTIFLVPAVANTQEFAPEPLRIGNPDEQITRISTTAKIRDGRSIGMIMLNRVGFASVWLAEGVKRRPLAREGMTNGPPCPRSEVAHWHRAICNRAW